MQAIARQPHTSILTSLHPIRHKSPSPYVDGTLYFGAYAATTLQTARRQEITSPYGGDQCLRNKPRELPYNLQLHRIALGIVC